MVCIDETIETKPMRQQFPVVLFIMLYKVVLDFEIISNGNRTEWSPIRSVIIRVINKIGRPRSGSPI